MTEHLVPQVVIVAGGTGKRLEPLTDATPKILVPVAGRPFLDFVLELLHGEGATRVHFCLGHLADQVIGHLACRRDAGIRYTISVEQQPLGTAGALRDALPWLDSEFLLLLGDTYTPVCFRQLTHRFRATARAAAMVVLHNHDRYVPSNVRVENGNVVEYSKGERPGRLTYVDYGIAFLRRERLLRIETGAKTDLESLFGALIAEGELAALEVSQRFFEIGSPTGHNEFERLVKATSVLPQASP